MKKNKMSRFTILILGIVTLSLNACKDSKKEFEITAKIPGMYNGLIVELINDEDGNNSLMAIDTVENESFVLHGSVQEPVAAKLVITNRALIPEDASYEQQFETTTSLWVENVKMQYKAAHLDSIPLSYVYLSSPLYKEANVSVDGGKGEEMFTAFRNQLRPYEIDYSEKSMRYYSWDEKSEVSKENLYNDLHNAHQSLLTAYKSFIEQKGGSVSLFIMSKFLDAEYSFSQEDLAIWRKVAGAVEGDSIRVSEIKKKLDEMAPYTTGTPFQDIDVLTGKGKKLRLSDFMEEEKFLFVDVWASWCMPCLAAVPTVKQLHSKYNSKVKFVSLSIDKDEKQWRKALEKEDMEWSQLLRDTATMDQLEKAYHLMSVPTFILVDKSGTILHVGHDPGSLDIIFSKIIK
ncbi:TlpA family protein disulfide reductase [Labilibaculum euxinus]